MTSPLGVNLVVLAGVLLVANALFAITSAILGWQDARWFGVAALALTPPWLALAGAGIVLPGLLAAAFVLLWPSAALLARGGPTGSVATMGVSALSAPLLILSFPGQYGSLLGLWATCTLVTLAGFTLGFRETWSHGWDLETVPPGR